jgi:hypothetical protein
MAYPNERAPSGRGARSETAFLAGDVSDHSQSALVTQARCALIREALADDLDRIAMFAEMGLIAIDGEDDNTLVRMADQMFKVCLSAAANLGELLAALDGGSP